MRYFFFGWRSLRKLMYFIKDIVFYIFIFALGFLIGSGIIKVKAIDETCVSKTINLPTELNGRDNKDYLEQLLEIDDLLQNKNKLYTITLSYRKNDEYPSGVYYSAEIVLYNLNTLNATDSFISYSSSYKKYRKTLFLSENFVNSFIESLKNENYLTAFEETNATIYLYREEYLSSKTYYTQVLFSHNLTSVKNSNSCDYVINNISIAQNEEMLQFKELVVPKKTIYTENLRINAKNIDRIEYTFDFASEMNEARQFTHEFNFSTTWYSSVARLDLFSPPYLQYKKLENTYNLPMDAHRQATLDQVVYYDTQLNPFTDINELKFVVDFKNINELKEDNSSVLIHFDTNLNFTRKIIYNSDPESSSSYYDTVDWSQKYGIYLIPKLIKDEENQEVYSSVFYQGKQLKIDVYDSIDTSIAPVKSYSDYHNVGGVWGNFNYLFRFNNYNQMFFFTNQNYLNDTEPTRLRYDTRYFVYSVCETEFKCSPVTNPNTGETITPKPPQQGNDDSYNFNSVVKKIKEFVKSLHTNLDPIAQTIQYFYDSLPGMLQNFLIVIYTSFLFFGLYRIIRR